MCLTWFEIGKRGRKLTILREFTAERNVGSGQPKRLVASQRFNGITYLFDYILIICQCICDNNYNVANSIISRSYTANIHFPLIPFNWSRFLPTFETVNV